MAEMLATNFATDDRRRVVNGGRMGGPDIEMATMRFMAEGGLESISSTAIATRGERLVLARQLFSLHDGPQSFQNEIVDVIEIDSSGKLSGHVMFDPDDIDAAFAELDARYLAGEAAPYARVWRSAIDTLAEANRHEPGPILAGLTYVDHRRDLVRV